jgi:hypothetical protein
MSSFSLVMKRAGFATAASFVICVHQKSFRAGAAGTGKVGDQNGLSAPMKPASPMVIQ